MCLYISGTNHQTHICFYTFLAKIIKKQYVFIHFWHKTHKIWVFSRFSSNNHQAYFCAYIYTHIHTCTYIHRYTYTDILFLGPGEVVEAGWDCLGFVICLPILLYLPKGPSPPDPTVYICCLHWFCYFCQFCCIFLRGPAPQTHTVYICCLHRFC